MLLIRGAAAQASAERDSTTKIEELARAEAVKLCKNDQP